MVGKGVEEPKATLEVENIGGIDNTVVEFDPGVTILAGRNATNRTSLLQSIMAVLGSNNATLKANSKTGRVELAIDNETYSRTLTRNGDSVNYSGDPYLDDSMLADLFAFLLETNECRQAVARGNDLRELIMRPVDTEKIEREIRQLVSERDEVDEKLDELSNLSSKLPEIKQEKQRLEDEISEKEERLTQKREELDNLDKSVEESRDENEELDTRMSELQEARTEVKNLEREIESEEESIAALEQDVAEQKSELTDLSAVPEGRIQSISEEIQYQRGRVDALDQEVAELQSVIQFNEELLEDGHREIAEQLETGTETDSDTVTDKLLVDDNTITCWTCGSQVDTTQIESTLENLRSLRQEKVQEREEIKEEINEDQQEKTKLEERRERRKNLQSQIEQNESEITERKERIESLKAQKERAEAEVSQLEEAVTTLQQEDQSEVLAVQEEVNELEFELSTLTSSLADTEERIQSIESQLEEREELKSRRTEIQDNLEDLRTRVEQLQKQAITEFNDHMEAILDLLDYNNLERIWIERKQENVRDGRQKVEKDRFELHVIRSTESNTAYEDTVDHLSESEREVTGLVFGLAGYLVHDVYETVPFMLLDSIEAIDSNRIAKLVDYLEEYAEYLVVALLEEDAAALDEEYSRITSI